MTLVTAAPVRGRQNPQARRRVPGACDTAGPPAPWCLAPGFSCLLEEEPHTRQALVHRQGFTPTHPRTLCLGLYFRSLVISL